MDKQDYIDKRDDELRILEEKVVAMKRCGRSAAYIAAHLGVSEFKIRSIYFDLKTKRRQEKSQQLISRKGLLGPPQKLTADQRRDLHYIEDRKDAWRLKEIKKLHEVGIKEGVAAEAEVEKKEPAKPRLVYENRIAKTHKMDLGGSRIYSFGLMGDTQFNSKYTQITYLNQFYDLCERRQITDVFHTGDMDEGEQMRMGHQYECYTQGADAHVAEIVARYPRRSGIRTSFITGNHDASIFKRCGVDIGKAIAASRDDMTYLGRDVARIEITPNCILELRHPWDGTAYAISYKIQKMVEAMEADSKPNILAVGHYHKLEYLFHRNVHCFQTGCFQSQTPFMRGKSISAHMGGWIITIEVDDLGHVLRVVNEMIPFYKGIVNDYLTAR